MAAKRNGGIELYRVFLTFGIVLLHAMTTCGHTATGGWARGAYFLYSCVVGFVFISGWFGVKLSVMRLLKVWGIALYSAAVVGTIDIALNGWHGFDAYFRILTGNWFLNGYTVLILLAPLVNLAIEARAYRSLVGCLALVFGWAFLATAPHISCWIPRSTGIIDYSGITLVGIYAAARLMRTCDVERRLTKWHRCCIFSLSAVAIACHLSSYASPFAFVFSGILFLGFKNIAIPSWVQRSAVWLAPSTFTIFMLHANSIGFLFMNRWESSFVEIGMGMNASMVVVACVVFGVGCAVDVPRRICLGGLASLRQTVLRRSKHGE